MNAGQRSSIPAERLSRAWERYLKTGKAPIQSLQSAFAKFKQWLTDIYGAIKEVARHPLGLKSLGLTKTEFKQVSLMFDRWLGKKISLKEIVEIGQAKKQRQQARRQASKLRADVLAAGSKLGVETRSEIQDYIMRAQYEAGEQYGVDRIDTKFAGPFPGEVKDWLRKKPPNIRALFKENVKGGMGEDSAAMMGGYDAYFDYVTQQATGQERSQEQHIDDIAEFAKRVGDADTLAKVEVYREMRDADEPAANLDAMIAQKTREWENRIYGDQSDTNQFGPAYDVFDDTMETENDTLYQEQPAEDEDTTSIKNRIVDKERARRGRGPMPQPKPQTRQQWIDQARARLQEDPAMPARLIAELRGQPRNLSDVEIAALQLCRRTVRNGYESAVDNLFAAADAGDEDARIEAWRAAEDYDAQMQVLEEATKAAGTEWGRAGVARQIELREDFSLAAMSRRMRVAKGGKSLTEAELARVKQEYEAIKAKNKKLQISLDAAQKQVRELEIQKLIKTTPRLTPAAQQRKAMTARKTQLIEKVRRKLQASGLNQTLYQADAGADLDAETAADVGEIGSIIYAEGTKTADKWRKAMIDAVGNGVEPYLDNAWTQAVKAGASQSRQRATEAVRTARAAGRTGSDIAKAAQEIARSFVAEGVTDRDALIDAVHGVLQEIDSAITRDETMDAISGYGNYKLLSKDEISTKLRELKGEMQQLGKLRDMERGQAPLKTGIERRTPSDEERRLIRKVNEAKKAGGYDVTDPETQLRTTLDATKTRLKNQIADLSLALATKQRIEGKQSAPVSSPEIEWMRQLRDELKRQYLDIFGKPSRKLTDQQRQNMAIKAVERSIERYNERIIANQPYSNKQAAKVTNPFLEALKARRNSLRDELNALKDPAKVFNDAYEHRTRRQMAELQEKLANQDFAPLVKRQAPDLTPQNVKLMFELDQLKRRHREGVLRAQLSQRTMIRKIFDTAGELLSMPRSFLTSIDWSAVFRQGGFIVLGHPVRAAKALPAMFKATFSQKAAYQTDQNIRNRPNYMFYKNSGLYLSEHEGPLSKMEEVYMSRWAEKIPGLGRLIAGSQRAYTTFLNKLRVDSFDAMAAGLSRDGKLTLKEAKAIANFINVATGRGAAGKATNALAGLNAVFFAPRLAISRFQLLVGQPLWRGDMKTRKMIALEYGRFLAGLAVVYALGALAGACDDDDEPVLEFDPRSSDFGKIRLGNTRIDPLAGLSQTAVFMARISTGETKTASGKIKPIRGDVPYGSSTTADVITRFLRSKLSPVVGTGLNIATGKNVVGEDVTLLSTLRDTTIPLSLRDVYETMREQGVPKGTAISLLSVFGMGVQNYQTKEREEAASFSLPRLSPSLKPPKLRP